MTRDGRDQEMPFPWVTVEHNLRLGVQLLILMRFSMSLPQQSEWMGFRYFMFRMMLKWDRGPTLELMQLWETTMTFSTELYEFCSQIVCKAAPRAVKQDEEVTSLPNQQCQNMSTWMQQRFLNPIAVVWVEWSLWHAWYAWRHLSPLIGD